MPVFGPSLEVNSNSMAVPEVNNKTVFLFYSFYHRREDDQYYFVKLLSLPKQVGYVG